MSHYIALIHKDPDSEYGVSFPDFPGVVSAGKDLDEARAMAEEALAFHIAGLIEDQEALPEASSLEQVMSDEVNRDGAVVLITAKLPETKSIRINVSLPEPVLNRIDKFVADHGLDSRSAFLAEAATNEIERAA